MKNLSFIITIVAILLFSACKKEEVKPDSTIVKSEFRFRVYHNANDNHIFDENLSYNTTYFITNDTVIVYYSNYYNDGKYGMPMMSFSLDNSEDSLFINNSSQVSNIYLDQSKIHQVDIKTKTNEKFHYKLVLKRAYCSFDYSCFFDSLCTDSVKIQKSVTIDSSFISTSVLQANKVSEYLYNDQVSEKNGQVNQVFYFQYYMPYTVNTGNFSPNFYFKLLKLNRNMTGLIKTYNLKNDAFVIFYSGYGYASCSFKSQDINGTLTITSYDAASNRISGYFSFSCTSEYKGYKSSPAKITVSNGKFENIPLWTEN